MLTTTKEVDRNFPSGPVVNTLEFPLVVVLRNPTLSCLVALGKVESSQTRDGNNVSSLADRFLTSEPPGSEDQRQQTNKKTSRYPEKLTDQLALESSWLISQWQDEVLCLISSSFSPAALVERD